MRVLSRRTLLRGVGGVALGLPLLDAMTRRAHAQTAAPRRIIFEFKPNGDQTDRRFTSTGETDFQFDEFLAPLEPYRDELLILNRLDKRFYSLPENERADNHQQGGMALAPWQAGEGDFPVGGEERTIGYVLGPSADYEIGERVLGEVPGLPYRHLVYRVGGRENNIWNLSSHAGPAGQSNLVIPETDPYAAYARLFSADSGGNAEAEAALRQRLLVKQSMLDLLVSENDSLVQQLGADDRRRVEQYTEALRDIERTLQPSSEAGACNPVSIGEPIDVYSDDNHQVVGEAFQKIIAMSFACDLTRSVNFNWHGNTSNRVYRNLGLEEGHHDISHKSDADAFAEVRRIHTHLWTMSTNLYEVLKATPEGDGSVWDNTLVVHWNELGQGDAHSINDIMTIFAGGMSGYFTRGRYLDFGNDMGFSEMLVSCLHYMGFEDVERFGDERLSTGGPVPGITA
jgi:Protein of unknown function (DUF1552)